MLHRGKEHGKGDYVFIYNKYKDTHIISGYIYIHDTSHYSTLLSPVSIQKSQPSTEALASKNVLNELLPHGWLEWIAEHTPVAPWFSKTPRFLQFFWGGMEDLMVGNRLKGLDKIWPAARGWLKDSFLIAKRSLLHDVS